MSVAISLYVWFSIRKTRKPQTALNPIDPHIAVCNPYFHFEGYYYKLADSHFSLPFALGTNGWLADAFAPATDHAVTSHGLGLRVGRVQGQGIGSGVWVAQEFWGVVQFFTPTNVQGSGIWG